MYRCEATTVGGFVQQLAVQYVTHGYWFYVLGRIPAGKDPSSVDAKLVDRYRMACSSAESTSGVVFEVVTRQPRIRRE